MKDFLFITHDCVDPYFNLASEEYLLKQRTENFIYLWTNCKAVIVGANQNTAKEVNIAYAKDHDIAIVRRLTGGGTVYHDQNCLCYTIIAPYDSEKDNYKEFTKPVIEYLQGLGINASFSGRNDITVDGKKISGNAQTVYNGRIMHHGTILFNTKMENLSKVLCVDKLKIESKGINSIRARVTNIYDLLKEKITFEKFKKGLCDKFKAKTNEYVFNNADIKAINALKKDKYAKFEWNIGCSPKGKITFNERFAFGGININFDLIEGKIQNTYITGDFFSLKEVRVLEDRLNGIKYTKEDIEKAFDGVEKIIYKANKKEILEKFFN